MLSMNAVIVPTGAPTAHPTIPPIVDPTSPSSFVIVNEKLPPHSFDDSERRPPPYCFAAPRLRADGQLVRTTSGGVRRVAESDCVASSRNSPLGNTSYDGRPRVFM